MKTNRFFIFLGILAILVGLLNYAGVIHLFSFGEPQEEVVEEMEKNEIIEFEEEIEVELDVDENVDNDEAEPDVNLFIVVDQEPEPINLRDIQKEIGYPEQAREAGIQGNVVVRILVDEEGSYIKHNVLNSVHPLLEEAVVNKIEALTFEPAIKDGKEIKFWVNVPFKFELLN